MKRLRNWFANLDLNSRLLLVFSLLFVVEILTLASFMQMAIDTIDHNLTSRDLYANLQKIYRLQESLQKMQVAQSRYQVDPNDMDRAIFLSNQERLLQGVSDLVDDQFRQDDEETAQSLEQLDRLEAATLQYGLLFEQMVAAGQAQDWETLYQQDLQAMQIAREMDSSLQDFSQVWLEDLDYVKWDVDSFWFKSLFAILIALPVFIVLVLISAVVIHMRMNKPLQVLVDAVKDVESGSGGSPEHFPNVRNQASRSDEIGYLSREFLQMAGVAASRREKLQQKAAEIRAKIR